MLAQVDSRFLKLSLKKSYTRFLSYAFYEGRPLTTKGRWINPLVFALYRLQIHLPFAKKVIKPIFIIGTGRSGTTILGVTLAMHNDVGFLNEPKALWSYLFAWEDLIGSYRVKEGCYRLSAEDCTDKLIKNANRIYGNYLRFCLSSRVVDKYPELIFRTEFVTTIFPDARFLFLYRNGHDTCHSISSWSERLGKEEHNETHDWWGCDDRKWRLLCNQIVARDDAIGKYVDEIRHFKNNEHRAAVEWIVTMKEGLSLLARKSYKVMGIKYEKYVCSLETRQQVLDFCQLPPDDRFDQFSLSVLNAATARPKLDLPLVIENEFLRVMKQLDYEE